MKLKDLMDFIALRWQLISHLTHYIAYSFVVLFVQKKKNNISMHTLGLLSICYDMVLLCNI
jgi:hypothetical protein